MGLSRVLLTGAVAVFVTAGSHPGLSLHAQGKAPTFDVDKLWPMPLPNHWVYGSITGLAIDNRDHVFVATRPQSVAQGNEAGLMSNPPTAEHCCLAAPPILEFNPDGTLARSWGGDGAGYNWPVATGGIAIDAAGNLWITAAGVPEPAAAAAGATGVVPRANRGGGAAPAAGRGGRGAEVIPGAEGAPVAPAAGRGRGNADAGAPGDAHILKFSADGRFLMQIGKPGQTAKDAPVNLDRPADIAVSGGELFIADGGDHQRVVVLDAATGAFKRQWSGHDGPFQRLSSIAVATDGNVYVGDRKGNNVQVFKKDGTFVKRLDVAKGTTANGSVWDVNFSSDEDQTWLFVADGQNSTVRVFNRATLAPAGTIGDGGRWPGRFYAVNNVQMDSKGNLFTGEGYEGKRVQKFIKK